MKTFSQLLAAAALLFAGSSSAAILNEIELVSNSLQKEGWVGQPETYLYRDFKHATIALVGGQMTALPAACQGEPPIHFVLRGAFEGDATKICFGGYTKVQDGVTKLSYAYCVLSAVSKHASNCAEIDLQLCRTDESVLRAQK